MASFYSPAPVTPRPLNPGNPNTWARPYQHPASTAHAFNLSSNPLIPVHAPPSAPTPTEIPQRYEDAVAAAEARLAPAFEAGELDEDDIMGEQLDAGLFTLQARTGGDSGKGWRALRGAWAIVAS